MDHVDELQGSYECLEQLGLGAPDQELVSRFASRFSQRVRYFKVNRGLSLSLKVVIKPDTLFPFLAKLDSKAALSQEYQGYCLLRFRVPPLSIPPLEYFEASDERAILVYRYITGGRVRDLVGRLDALPPDRRTDLIVEEVLDQILKKCHWLDGEFQMLPIGLPDLRCPDDVLDIGHWAEVRAAYVRAREMANGVRAPHGITHGDLHPKNVLLVEGRRPVLIDFSFSKEGSCVYVDYAKLEVFGHFQIAWGEFDNFGSVRERMYSHECLVLPRSRLPLARYIHGIRSILWRNCMSRSVGLTSAEVDRGYRVHLAYFLARAWSNPRLSDASRKVAFASLKGLTTELSANANGVPS